MIARLLRWLRLAPAQFFKIEGVDLVQAIRRRPLIRDGFRWRVMTAEEWAGSVAKKDNTP